MPALRRSRERWEPLAASNSLPLFSHQRELAALQHLVEAFGWRRKLVRLAGGQGAERNLFGAGDGQAAFRHEPAGDAADLGDAGGEREGRGVIARQQVKVAALADLERIA